MPYATRPLSDDSAKPPAGRRWLARFGFWGFVFFLLKGLAWILVPSLLALEIAD